MNRRDAAARWLWAHDGLPEHLFEVGMWTDGFLSPPPTNSAMTQLRELYRTKADQLLATIDAAERT